MPSKNPKNRVPSGVLVKTVRILALAVSRLLWRIEFHGTENIPAKGTGGFIVASNHPTYFDPFWISLPIYADLRFLAWDRAFHLPVAGRLISWLGAIPMSLDPGGTTGTLKRSLQILKQGCALVIFPEGEREFGDGELLPFKTGVAQLAARTGVPVLPVSVRGGNRVWPRDRVYPGIGKVIVYFHPTFRIERKDEDADLHSFLKEQTEKLRRIIAQGLNEED